jgi:DNA-binding CsgD family transcriptional regulator
MASTAWSSSRTATVRGFEPKTSKEIAGQLGLSPRTIENHRTNICAKLDVHGIHSLVKFAYENRSKL